MDTGDSTPSQDDAPCDAAAKLHRSDDMARWRWVLFALMSRLDVGGEIYGRIPKGRILWCDMMATPQVAGASTPARFRP